MTQKGYHYKQCGLDNIYLLNGYTVQETPYGRGVSINDVENLHQAIAKSIITSQHAMRGQEVRFLREMLDVSQSGLARILGVATQTVKKWEKHRKSPVQGPADRALRQFYAQKMCGDELAERICDLLAEIDNLEYQLTTFTSEQDEWRLAA